MVRDIYGYLSGTAEKYLDVTVITLSHDGEEMDPETPAASDTCHILKAVDGVIARVHREGEDTININPPSFRTKFEKESWFHPEYDVDDSPEVTLEPNEHVYGLDAPREYRFAEDDLFLVTISGNLAGIKWIVWGGYEDIPGLTTVVTAEDKENGYVVLTIPTDWRHPRLIGDERRIRIYVDGTTPLDDRMLFIQIDSVIAINPANNNTELLTTSLTEWEVNGTILVANYANANTGFWRSRFYIWNAMEKPAVVIVSVKTLPLSDHPLSPGQVQPLVPGTALKSELVGGHMLTYSFMIPGQMGGSGITIKLEDILNQLGVTMPYLGPDGNGNVYVEFAVGAKACSGWVQTFSSDATTTFMGTEMMMKNPYRAEENEHRRGGDDFITVPQ